MFDSELVTLANEIAGLNRERRVEEIIDRFYAEDVVSIEAADIPGVPPGVTCRSEGVEALKAKHDWFFSVFELNDCAVDGPFFHGEDRFSLIYRHVLTHRASGERSDATEIGIYTVAGGKIVREEFYYDC